MPRAAATLAPLTDMLRKQPKRSRKPLVWTAASDTAFNPVKSALADVTMLAHPSTDLPTSLSVDASDTAVGGVLQQLTDGDWRPIAFFSHHLKPPETRYSTFGRELLAMYLAIKHFRYFLEGREFHIFTDHKPLVYALNSSPDRHSPREVRHLDFLSQFTSDIRHVHGVDNVVADALSRVEISAVHTSSSIDLRGIAADQEHDEELAASRTDTSSLTMEKTLFADGTGHIWCDVSTGRATAPFCACRTPPSSVRVVALPFPPWHQGHAEVGCFTFRLARH